MRGSYLPGSAVGRIAGNAPGSRANIYSTGSDKLCQPGSRVIRAFSDVEKLLLFSVSVVKGTSEKAWISSRVNKFY